MGSDDDKDKKHTAKLHSKEQFISWKEDVRALVREKAKKKLKAIFTDDGSDATVGYGAIQGRGAAAVELREDWEDLAEELVGKVAVLASCLTVPRTRGPVSQTQKAWVEVGGSFVIWWDVAQLGVHTGPATRESRATPLLSLESEFL